MANRRKNTAIFRFEICEKTLNTPATELPLENRYMNIIERNKWKTIDDIIEAINDKSFYSASGMGLMAIKKIKSAIVNLELESKTDKEAENYICDVEIRRAL